MTQKWVLTGTPVCGRVEKQPIRHDVQSLDADGVFPGNVLADSVDYDSSSDNVDCDSRSDTMCDAMRTVAIMEQDVPTVYLSSSSQ